MRLSVKVLLETTLLSHLCSNGKLCLLTQVYILEGKSLENYFASMLAQQKTVLLIKNAIKLAFFRIVEYLEHQKL